ncbi:MAG: response regulator transcription factor [Anaerolineales bacterium]|nr:response regulator transcription factor [Anaerolineales bacterium]
MATKLPAGKLLIIDDDRSSTELLVNVLSPYQQEILIANTAREGLRMAGQIQPDLIIVDLSLPDLDGLTVCRRLRAVTDRPILALSVVDQASMLEQALDAGADDYLVKPVSNSILIAHLNNLARRNRSRFLPLLSNT